MAPANPSVQYTQLVVSVVSHGQGELVADLLRDLERHCSEFPLAVVLTLNKPESLPFSVQDFRFPLLLVRNEVPRGFGANHNAAFEKTRCSYFCVVNPDVRLTMNPFPELLNTFRDEAVGVAAPVIVDVSGRVEDSARKLPTPLVIVKKLFRGRPAPDYEIADRIVYPDWVGGMFMCFKSQAFTQLQGFDERYFLYYEDVDLCCRARLAGQRVVLTPAARVIHDARRESRRNLRYFRWHIASLARFFASPVFFAVLGGRLTNRSH